MKEAKDAEFVFKSLPKIVGEAAASRWKEYEDRITLEGRFAYALDKIEPAFELLDPITEKSLKRTKFTYEAHLGKKQEATEGFPVMRRFVDVLATRMKERGVFWEESPI
jgi:5'-deoxynucleotidase YfbR-like HD superfamily hydrolase